MYTLVFTAPNILTAEFHVTKQSADAANPRKRMLNRWFGVSSSFRVGLNPNMNKAGIINTNPYKKTLRVA